MENPHQKILTHVFKNETYVHEVLQNPKNKYAAPNKTCAHKLAEYGLIYDAKLEQFTLREN